ncbi:MAG: hypothetical protein IIZ78_05135 [Clostridiales bacterium]|nr:hypothetical protein [Clostridiales bacterium]
MTEAEAKRIISSYGAPANIAQHIEAINVALEVLGQDATMEDVWKWASTE